MRREMTSRANFFGVMKRRVVMAGRVSALCASAALLGVVTGCGTVPPSQPPAHEGLEPTTFVPIDPISWKTAEGVTVVYLPDEELPLISFSVTFPGGTYRTQDPLSARVMGALLRRGGAGALTREEIDRELRERSALIESGADGESIAVSANCLKGDELRIAELVRSMFEQPRFSEEEFSLIKKQLHEQVVRRKDDPDTIAGVVLGQLLYGNRSPYIDASTARSVARLSRADVIREYRQLLPSSGAIVSVSGDITRPEVDSLVAKLVGGVKWSESSLGSKPFPPVSDAVRPGAYFVEGAFSQATILIGQLGVSRLPPDWYEILVFNDLFGSGSMSSRLFAEIRTKRGLAYVAAGGISPGVVQGKNYSYVQTKSASVGEAIDASMGVLKGLQDAPPPSDEVDDRKRALINSFVFANKSPADIVGRRAGFLLQNYPLDYDKRFVSNVQKVAPEGIQRVARERWDPNKFVVVVVGDKAARESLQQSQFVREGVARLGKKGGITELRFQDIGAGIGIRR